MIWNCEVCKTRMLARSMPCSKCGKTCKRPTLKQEIRSFKKWLKARNPNSTLAFSQALLDEIHDYQYIKHWAPDLIKLEDGTELGSNAWQQGIKIDEIGLKLTNLFTIEEILKDIEYGLEEYKAKEKKK